MSTRLARVCTTPLLLCTLAVAAGAAVPTFWQTATEADFLKGEVDNLAIDAYGRLTLGPAAAAVYEASAPFLWTVTSTPDGVTYIGSGNEGQVYQVDAAGRGRVFFDSDELEVHALAPAPGGGLFVATSPNGKIYKVDAAGNGTVFYDPPDTYIWSLAVDRAGNLFAGTGDKGTIYKVTPGGRGAVFYQTKATHAITLAFDREGRLLAGTSAPGRVFQIDAAGKPFVLFDSSYGEIHALRVDATGTVYATAISSRSGGGDGQPSRPAPEPAAQPVASVSTEITSVSVADVSVTASASQAPTARSQGPASGAVFTITTDGATDLVWESRDDTPYDVAFEADGSVLVATGNKGKIYRLSGSPARATLLAQANAQQVTTLALDRNGQVLFATSNPGKLFRLSAARADRGTYTSEVRDAQTVATWGALKWQALAPAGTRIEVATRSGNTKTPDEAWSDWSAPYATSDGSPITSPRARYLQWRAVLVGGARAEPPLLTSLTAAYLPRNTRPRVASITVHTPGTVYQRPFPTGDPEIAGFDGDTPDRRAAAQLQGSNAGGSPSLGRRGYEKGLLTFIWRAEDENRDDLEYELSYRREGDTAWRTLKRGLTDSILVWDTTSVPNGRYTVRVVASDAPSNSPASALTGEMESTAFDIDNTPPTITITSVRRDGPRSIIAFDVRDDHSAVVGADYSLDGDRWQALYPKDGIADSRFEQFEVSVGEDAAARGVVVRATDALNNVSSAQADAPAAPTPASGRR